MKVLIVGGGPAGLTCAEQILEQRMHSDVTVVDKKSRIGENPRCAGGVSLWLAEQVGFSISQSCVVANIRRVRMYSPNGKYWELKGDKDYGCILDRSRFEQDMAERVEKLTGKIVLSYLVSTRDLNFWLSQYDYIVGADGYPSVVRQWLRLPNYPAMDTHLGVQKTIEMDYYPQDTIELYFGQKVAPEGYAWIFPAGHGFVRIGLGIPVWRGWQAHNFLETFIQRQTVEYKEINSIAKQIPTARMPETCVYHRVLLVGDALPSTDPVTGGGISQGIASGKAAARALAEGNPKNYDQYINWLRRQNNRRYKLKQVLYSFSDQDFNDLIKVMGGFRPKTMSVGIELRRAVVHLLLRKPRLLRKFFRYLH